MTHSSVVPPGVHLGKGSTLFGNTKSVMNRLGGVIFSVVIYKPAGRWRDNDGMTGDCIVAGHFCLGVLVMVMIVAPVSHLSQGHYCAGMSHWCSGSTSSERE